MRRKDLLALTVDDLATLTNRGTVKRAAREWEAGSLICTFDEHNDGRLVARWSDGTTCEFPAGGSLDDAICSSGSVGISRHVVRSVLAYQQQTADEHVAGEEPVDWNPGDITDEQLEQHFRKAAVTRARKSFEQGVLVEVVRGRKPLARFLSEPCTLRFMVPHDLRYIYSDCSERLQATYVPMAVWAFRELAAGQNAALVSIQREKLATPSDLLAELNRSIAELCEYGVAGCNYAWRDRASRLESRCRDADLVWPAEILADLIFQYQQYQEHDARFDPAEVVRLAGELLIRCDAIESNTGAVPQLLVRGTKSDTLSEIRAARFIGLGCGARISPSSIQLTAYLQDIGSGSVVGIPRDYNDPELGEPADFVDLSARTVARGVSMANLGAGQLLLKSGKRSPSHRLALPRGHVSVNPQAFEWEKLRAPVLAEGIAEIVLRLQSLPPAALRARRLTEDLHVCPLREVKSVDFDNASQQLVATVEDIHGDLATVVHPYHTRGRHGFEAIASWLKEHSSDIRFISGHVRLGQSRLVFHPLCVVFESNSGRVGVQPWIQPWDGATAELVDPETGSEITSPIAQVREQMSQLLAECLTTGLKTAARGGHQSWREFVHDCGEVGFVELTSQAEQLSVGFEKVAEMRAAETASWIAPTQQLLIWSRLITDLDSR